MNIIGQDLFNLLAPFPLNILSGVIPDVVYEAGDVVYTLATYTEPEWLTPGETYSTVTYPEAAAVFGDEAGSFTVDDYTAPEGYNVYVNSGEL